nr:T9SS type A sorting domain-containing protein [candidate division KSB1 bacterium]NIR69023.1 T9SS type A sorting domain-containing protein [candidate division KSB1 bacterium]NIS24095.1 T9SS type A sorting domain-containing protein [candidate division KSB1 bacterium]NIT71014.1 T9SS type A sorting domain-containing protein [candidate division KSB1 bacterium]NIU24714.1 T9SS type A sorting domain-containing protein [candidate division KSB1 bacterium]
IDMVAPPPGFGFYAAFNIPAFPDWLVSDIRSALDSTHTWTLTLLNTVGTTSTICWDSTSFFIHGTPVGSFMINQTDMLSDTCLQVSGDQNVTIRFKKAQVTEVRSPDNSKSVPEGFYLSQSYPNPFSVNSGQNRLGTAIQFRVPIRSFVNLQVYNLLGQNVRTLFDAIVEPRTHVVYWNGRDKFGRQLPQGVYVYYLRIGNLTMARKLMLIE